MYAVEVRDRIMVAHSLPDPFFGPAQKMHGATFIVDVAFFRETLTQHNVVVDIGAAHTTLDAILKPLRYSNLDDDASMKEHLTTTEFLARFIFDRMVEAIHAGHLGADAAGLSRLKVTLQENDLARAWFEASLDFSPK